MARKKVNKIVLFIVLGIIAINVIAAIVGLIYVLTHMDEWNSNREPRPSFTSVGSVGGFLIADEGNSYAVCSTDGSIRGDVVLPVEFEGHRITAILNGAFYGCSDVTSLTVPDCYVRIDSGAFKGLTGIRSLTVPFVGKEPAAEGSEAVLGYPFGVQSFRSYVDGYGEPKPQEGEFADAAPNNIPSENEGMTIQYAESIGSGYPLRLQFYAYYIPNTLEAVTVTNRTSIPLAAFRGCEHLESVNYTEDIKTIGNYAFAGCSSLSSFDTTASSTLDLRKGTYSGIGEGTFRGCKSINYILFREQSDTPIKTIGKRAFQDMEGVLNLVVPDSVTEIGAGAFAGCIRLSAITLPFVGRGANATQPYEKVFGYIFGYETKTVYNLAGAAGEGFSAEALPDDESAMPPEEGGDGEEEDPAETPAKKVLQYAEYSAAQGDASKHNTTFYLYGVPQSLMTVVITQDTSIPFAAFRNITTLNTVEYRKEVSPSDIGERAFEGCSVQGVL